MGTIRRRGYEAVTDQISGNCGSDERVRTVGEESQDEHDAELARHRYSPVVVVDVQL